VTLKNKEDLTELGPSQLCCLDGTVISGQSYLHMQFRVKPQLEEEVLDFIENFFETLQQEQ